MRSPLRSLAAICVALLSLSAAQALADTPLLFQPAATATDVPLGAKMKRARTMGIDTKLLVRQGTDSDSTIRLNLFPDVSLEGLVETTRMEQPGHFVTSGRITWTREDNFMFVVHGKTVAGTVTLGERKFRVLSAPGDDSAVIVTELEALQGNDCACGPEQKVIAPPQPLNADAANDDGSTLDILVAFTESARNAVGGTNQMNALIQLAVEESNVAYAASQVVPRLRLVHSTETVYSESAGFSPALNALTSKVDGKMDELHALRDEYGADLVSLIINNSQYCGIAWVMSNESAGFESSAFSVVAHNCATGYYSFAHELGHNMGLVHDIANSGGPGVKPYSYGFRWVGNSGSTWRSIMAYAPGTRIQRHANPNVLYDGVATGTVNQENTARSLNDVRNTIANFRQSVVGATPLITSSAIAYGKQNQPFTYQISATGNPTSYGATGLPSGLNINTSTGVISGTVSVTGQFNVLLSATNGAGTGTLSIVLHIIPDNCVARALVELRQRFAIPVQLGRLDEVLPTLRAVRDQILNRQPAGRELVKNYYDHGPQLTQTLIKNPALGAQALPLMIELLPNLQAGLRNGEGNFVLSDSQYERVEKLLEAAQAVVKPEARAWLVEVQELLTESAHETEDGQVILHVTDALEK